MTDEPYLGELQHEHRERICAAWRRHDSYLELCYKLHMGGEADDGASGELALLVSALLDSVDRLAAEVDKINGRV